MFRLRFPRRRRTQEVNEEFEAHLALESKLLQERGLSEQQADLSARRMFGNRSLVAEDVRQAWVWGWADRLSQDLRYAARTLLHNRAFTAAAILSIALGIGAATAVYSIADTVFFRPLPYENARQLTWVAIRFPSSMKMEFLGSPDYVTWRRNHDVFQSLAATQLSPGQMMLLNGDNPMEVRDVRVSANFLQTFGIRPAMGRDFESGEELPNGPKAVLLTNHLWKEHFHGSRDVVGKSIEMDGQSYTVIGVLPRSFQFPMDIKLDVLTTLPVLPTATWRDRSVSTWAAYGALKPGVTLAQARSALRVLLEQTRAGLPATFRSGIQLVVEPLQQHRIGNARLLLAVLVGAVTCLLLIACANVSNLLLARWSARSGEFAIRAAIGADRMRLARQLLTEVTLLTVTGCMLGLLFAFIVLRGFFHYAGNELPRLSEIGMDGRLFAIAFAVALAAALIFGLLPSLQAGGFDIRRVLQESDRMGLVAGSRTAKRVLIGFEVAVCAILLWGAALLTQTLWHLRNDRLGFKPEQVVSVSVPLKGTKLATGDRSRAVDEFLTFVHHIPGVEYATESECTPLSGGAMTLTFSRSDRPLPEAFHIGDSIHVCGTGPEYAAAAGLRVLRGRFFSERDFDHPLSVAVLNESAARTFFPGENPIGKRIMGAGGSWKTVIGVVSDSKNQGLDAAPAPQVFYNGVSYPEATSANFLIRSIGDQHVLESAVLGELRSIDRGLVAEFTPESNAIQEMSGGATFNAVLVGSFGLIAFVMALVGVYGVLAFAVGARTRDIGIRIALGGTRGRVFQLVLREGISPVLVGVALGLAAALTIERFVKTMLYGVSATDPTTFGLVALALLLASLVAISAPARRACRVDPLTALRHQ